MRARGVSKATAVGKLTGGYRCARGLRIAVVGPLVLALAGALSPLPAHAESKDMVRLEAQVQALADAVARLQQSNDERMGVLKDLVQQTSDAVNKMTLTVTNLQQQTANNHDASAKASEQLAGQIQALNDSLDELKARMQRMEKTLTDVQNQQGQASAMLSNMPAGAAGGGGAPAAAAAAPVAEPAPGGRGPRAGAPLPMPDDRGTAAAAPVAPAPTASGLSSAAMYRAAYSDFMAGKQQLAASEFNDLIKAYPDDNLSGNAYYYLGEMELRANHPAAAIKNYDRVIEQYPDNAKIPAAHLHKAQALSAERQNEAAGRELRALIARFPASPEAAQARPRLAALNRR